MTPNEAAPEPEVEAWASVLSENWETLARSPYRDFFIASNRGCDEPEIWNAMARFDAEVVLHELAPGQLADIDLLELGCGIGRLTELIAPRVRSYTGVDIAPTMLEQARKRQARLTNARFLLGNGARVPEPGRDRSYGLIFALAVFVHCPKPVIAALISDACLLLAPQGELRFHLRADEADATGITPLSEAPLTHKPPQLPTTPVRPDEAEGMRQASALLDGRYYMGHAFRHGEVLPFLESLVPVAKARLMRFDPHHIYVDLRVQPRPGKS